MKVEGVYTYLCNQCETLFAVVSRFSVKADRSQSLNCPKCSNQSYIVGEGFIKHRIIETLEESISEQIETTQSTLPELLTAEDVSKYMKVSKRVAYELMEGKDFPLIRIRRSKRVRREKFLQWLSTQSKNIL